MTVISNVLPAVIAVFVTPLETNNLEVVATLSAITADDVDVVI